MFFIKWNKIPEDLKNSDVKRYYDILSKRKFSIFFKRIFDIVLSVLLLVILSPLLLIISILIKTDSKGPVFYRQVRITRYGKKFKIYKFRTMVQNADKVGTLITLDNDNRITGIGKKIRKCRIDEIPQLINILKGEMTFVGTRPEVEKYVIKYSDDMKATLLMPAGVTSYASINYKDEDEQISKYLNSDNNVDEVYVEKILPEKMKWNLEYIEKFNIFRDVKICIDTVLSVIK